MTAPLSPSSLLYARDDDPAARTPQRSSSLSYKGHQQASGSSGRQQQRRSPLLNMASSGSSNNYEDDDEIPLHTRPASFAAPPSALSRYNQGNPPSPGNAMMDQQHSLSRMGTPPPGQRNTRSPNMNALPSFERQDPTPSTSRFPYDATSGNNRNSHSSNNLAFPPHTANPYTSTQRQNYLPYEQQQADSNQTRARQDSAGSSSSSSHNSRFMHSSHHNGTAQQQTHTPRRSRSVENNNESLPTSSSLSLPQRQFDNSSQGSSSSSTSTSRNLNAPNQSSNGQPIATTSSTSSTHRKPTQLCAKCNQPMTGQFVRALGTVFHLDCFRCQVRLFPYICLATLHLPFGI